MAAFSTFLRFLKWKMDGKWKLENAHCMATARCGVQVVSHPSSIWVVQQLREWPGGPGCRSLAAHEPRADFPRKSLAEWRAERWVANCRPKLKLRALSACS